jgi:hypothetical protein
LGNRSEVCGVLAHEKKETPNSLFLSQIKFGVPRMERFRMLMNMPNKFVKNCEVMSDGLACKD